MNVEGSRPSDLASAMSQPCGLPSIFRMRACRRCRLISIAACRPGVSASGHTVTSRPSSGDQSVFATARAPPLQVVRTNPGTLTEAHFSPSTTRYRIFRHEQGSQPIQGSVVLHGLLKMGFSVSAYTHREDGLPTLLLKACDAKEDFPFGVGIAPAIPGFSVTLSRFFGPCQSFESAQNPC